MVARILIAKITFESFYVIPRDKKVQKDLITLNDFWISGCMLSIREDRKNLYNRYKRNCIDKELEFSKYLDNTYLEIFED